MKNVRLASSAGPPDIIDVHPSTEVDVFIAQETHSSVPSESSNGQASNGDFRSGSAGAWWPGRVKSVKSGLVIVEVFFDGPSHPSQEVVDIENIRLRSHEQPLSPESFHQHLIEIPSDLTEL